MTRNETIALFMRCEEARKAALAEGKRPEEAHEAAKAVWNGWAEEMLAGRRALEEAGKWGVEKLPGGRIQAQNHASGAWMDAAQADFSGIRFEAAAAQPENARTEEDKVAASVPGSAVNMLQVDGEAVDFSGFVFPARAKFDGAQFSGNAEFNGAKFAGNARFEGVQFFGKTRFKDVEFAGDALFYGTQFSAFISFNRSKFAGDAIFALASFEQSANFENTRFNGRANFRAINGQRNFSLEGVVFEDAPDFIQAHFNEPPRLDAVTLAQEAEGKGLWRSVRHPASADVVARYRALRRLTAQGHDHENERVFLKREIRARRHTLDRLWHAAFWFGLAYDVLSDFGASIARPFAWGVVSVFAFAGLYYALIFAGCGSAGGEGFYQALYLSLKNAVQLINWDGADIPQAAKCVEAAKEASTSFALFLTVVQLIQKIWSASLLFLFLLAVRNRFRIK
jgi:hypothetical protein